MRAVIRLLARAVAAAAVSCAAGSALSADAGDARLEAAPGACAKLALGSARVLQVVSPFELTLEDGRSVRLAEISAYGEDGAAPDFDLPADFPLTAGETVSLHAQAREPDRRGRLIAHVVAGAPENRYWLQEWLVRGGLALVDTAASSRACAQWLLSAEEQARNAGAGYWGTGDFSISSGLDAEAAADRFVIVEGTVLSAQTAGATTYLNFGPVWKRDVTAIVRPRERAAMAREGFDPLALEGRRVRVRGYAIWHNGPEIKLTHKEQIEVLGPSPAPQPGAEDRQ